MVRVRKLGLGSALGLGLGLDLRNGGLPEWRTQIVVLGLIYLPCIYDAV